ncbi:MAG: hypothetical protein E6G57_16595 [Actinobacteria bacterium]|nr:MAG: hypothetical protein E6G57_16595 [Actinomycetota bacterium]
MKFKVPRRQGKFGTFHNRNEYDGPEKRLKAVDLPVRHPLKPRELDMVIPVIEGGIPTSQFLFGKNLRKPELTTPLLFPLQIHRSPEGIRFRVFDTKAGLTFDDVKIKDPLVITIDLDQNMEIAYKLQFHPGKHLQRISDNVEEHVCEFEVEAQQEEMFGQAEEEDEDAPPQGQLIPAGPASRRLVPDSNEDLGAVPGDESEEHEDDDDE